MVQYPAYCKTCDAITGHKTKFLDTECMKCHGVTRTPVVRWCVGIMALGILTLLAFWIMYASVVVLLHG